MLIGEKIARDVVKRVCYHDLLKDCGICSYRMQDLVVAEMQKFDAMEVLFNDLTRNFTVEDAAHIFNRSMEELFEPELNWGRLVTVYMLGAAVAKRLQETSTKAKVQQFVNETFVPAVNQRITPWVHHHGGWSSFLEFFAQRHDEPVSNFAMQLIAVGAAMLSAVVIFHH